MRNHPYLKAYMAGITIPTIFLLVVLSTVISIRHILELPIELEQFAVFPMAVVPNAWGAWNMLRVRSAAARRLPIGWYGSLLAVVLPLLGYGVGQAIGLELPLSIPTAVVGWIVAILLYYLIWKHLVAFLNELLGVHG